MDCQHQQFVQILIKLVSDRFDIEYDDIYEYIKMKVNFENYAIKNNTVHNVQKITMLEGKHVFFDMRTNGYYDNEKRKTEFVAVE